MIEPTDSKPPIPPGLPGTPRSRRFDFAPLEGAANPITVFETLLKHPGRIIYELCEGRFAAVATALTLVALVCLGIYGIVVGSLVGDNQLWIAPGKIALGSLLSAVICLPSLYIFLCLNGADTHLRQVGGMLAAAVCLTAVLLVGFAPVAWVFSQSTDSIGLMGFLHLVFWLVAFCFGMRLLSDCTSFAWGANAGSLSAWIVIYLIVSLQMMTSLRPIVGHADTLFPTEKQFFVSHWVQVLTQSVPAR